VIVGHVASAKARLLGATFDACVDQRSFQFTVTFSFGSFSPASFASILISSLQQSIPLAVSMRAMSSLASSLTVISFNMTSLRRREPIVIDRARFVASAARMRAYACAPRFALDASEPTDGRAAIARARANL
jgi:hypothetical protein